MASAASAPPMWIWLVLALAVTACSTGGLWFSLMPLVPPVLRAGWRLLVTAVMQFPLFLRDLVGNLDDGDDSKTTIAWTRYGDLQIDIVLSGVALAVHFAAWSISLTMTSLAHSLLFVCTTPLLLCAWQVVKCVVLMIMYRSREPIELFPTWIELLGAGVGFAAAAVLAGESSSSSDDNTDNESSLMGDLVAMGGAAAMGVYLSVGAKVRREVSLWMYVFPVTLVAGLVCVLGAWVFEPKVWQYSLTDSSSSNNNTIFYLVLAAAFTAGILGHTLANLALGYVSPLIVSVLLLSEPLIGSVLGYLAGVQHEPSLITMLCGFPLMLAAALVTVGGRGSWLHSKCGSA